jgi:coenzyme F420-reducing hydrogenase alpha subunit
MMTTLEPLRWLEEPAKVLVEKNNGAVQAYFQVTVPRDLSAMCQGRAVEELPRILSILSPSHHLVAAQLLDHLGDVTPPDLARNMREALLYCQVFRHHLRKLYFLLSAYGNPLTEPPGPRGRKDLSPVPRPVLDEAMEHLGLIQEAATILGGRSDHPLTAVTGGVSRFLKEGHYPRLAEIASASLAYARRLGDFLHSRVLAEGRIFAELTAIPSVQLASLTYDPAADLIGVVDASGQAQETFSPGEAAEKLAWHKEPWTYQPFLYLKDKGWQDLEASDHAGCFFVGPLARLNRNREIASEQAEAERQRLIEVLGQPPHYGLAAAAWMMLVELLEAGESLVALCTEENLSGPEIRHMPQAMGEVAQAALEAPEGLIFHRVQVDGQARVLNLEVFEAASANNAMRCLLAQAVVAEAAAQGRQLNSAQRSLELGLLPL